MFFFHSIQRKSFHFTARSNLFSRLVASQPQFFLRSACVTQPQGACLPQTFVDDQPLCYTKSKTTDHCQHETFLRGTFLPCLSPKYLQEGAIFFFSCEEVLSVLTTNLSIIRMFVSIKTE